jgi:hypothetical protein
MLIELFELCKNLCNKIYQIMGYYTCRSKLGLTFRTASKQCQLCSSIHDLLYMECGHVICEGCEELQCFYTLAPCILCQGLRWNMRQL